MTDRLVAIYIDDGGRPAPSPHMEQERRVAVLDLLEGNSFALPPRLVQSSACACSWTTSLRSAARCSASCST